MISGSDLYVIVYKYILQQIYWISLHTDMYEADTIPQYLPILHWLPRDIQQVDIRDTNFPLLTSDIRAATLLLPLSILYIKFCSAYDIESRGHFLLNSNIHKSTLLC